jgi:VIT1/CCC1 family predicted Fe2+/Mn2+ transporter
LLSKKPIVNAILSFVLGAAGLALFNFVMSLINGTSFKKEIGGTGNIIIDLVICAACGVAGYLQAKKAAK